MAKRDSTTDHPWGRNAEAAANLKTIIETERARLMAARAVLGCTRVALNNDNDSDVDPLEYADVVEVAREMIQQVTVRLDSAYLQKFYDSNG
jgi:hypothetical protein